MSPDVKRLLDEATPLPWTIFEHPLGHIVASPPKPNGKRDKVVLTPGMTPEDVAKADTALIVHAVNRLPDYEAAVDALERLVTTVEMFFAGAERDPAVIEARAVLRRLREPAA